MSFAEQALSIARAHHDEHNSARALAMIGLDLIILKLSAQSVLQESGTLFQQSQDEWGYAYTVFLRGWNSFAKTDLVSALPIIEQACTILKNLGNDILCA